jgi:hypothetical protein
VLRQGHDWNRFWSPSANATAQLSVYAGKGRTLAVVSTKTSTVRKRRQQ